MKNRTSEHIFELVCQRAATSAGFPRDKCHIEDLRLVRLLYLCQTNRLGADPAHNNKQALDLGSGKQQQTHLISTCVVEGSPSRGSFLIMLIRLCS